MLLEYRVEVLQISVAAVGSDLFDRISAEYQTFLSFSELAVEYVLINSAADFILELVSKMVCADEKLLCQ